MCLLTWIKKLCVLVSGMCTSINGNRSLLSTKMLLIIKGMDVHFSWINLTASCPPIYNTVWFVMICGHILWSCWAIFIAIFDSILAVWTCIPVEFCAILAVALHPSHTLRSKQSSNSNPWFPCSTCVKLGVQHPWRWYSTSPSYPSCGSAQVRARVHTNINRELLLDAIPPTKSFELLIYMFSPSIIAQILSLQPDSFSAIALKSLNVLKASNFRFKKETHAFLDKSSMKVRIYMAPPCLLVCMVPTRSVWTNAKRA